jgi:hypothetical protein
MARRRRISRKKPLRNLARYPLIQLDGKIASPPSSRRSHPDAALSFESAVLRLDGKIISIPDGGHRGQERASR